MSDLISRQAAREAMLKKGQSSRRYKLGEVWELNWLEIEEALSSIPIMETEPVKHGHWEQVDDNKCKCTNCGTVAFIALYPNGANNNYCPNCGARMDGENE